MNSRHSSRITLTLLLLFGFLAFSPFPVSAEETSTTTDANLSTSSTSTTAATTSTTDNPSTASTTGEIAIEPVEDSTPSVVNLHLRYEDTVIYDGAVTLPEEVSFSYHTGDRTASLSTTTAGTTALATLLTADEEADDFTLSDIQYYESFGSFIVNCLRLTIPTTTDACYNWQYVVDGTYPFVGMDSYTLTGGESIHVYYGDRFRISSDVSRVLSGSPVIVTIEEYDFETGQYTPNSTETINWQKPGGDPLFNGAATEGLVTVQPVTPGTHTVGVGDFLWPNTSVDVLPTRLTVIEDGTVIYDQLTTLPTSTTFDYTVSGSSTLLTTTTVGSDVLSLIAQEDAASTVFDVTLLEYYDSFGSFYLNCIRGAETEPSCNNWRYTVGGEHQFIGADQFTLNAGDHVHLYFGDRYRLRLDQTSVTLGEEITATLEEFGTTANEYVTLADGSVVALMDTTGTVLATSTIDTTGIVRFTPTEAGAYTLALERGAAPWIYYEAGTDSVTVQSTPTPEPPSPTSGDSGSSSGSGGGGTYTATITHQNIDRDTALAYLRNAEREDGSFGSALYTDWAALALTAAGTSTDRVRQYLITHTDAGSLLTDYERRALALLAVGLDPRTDTDMDYVDLILEAFDGQQFGDIDLVNDDIFALFPLSAMGYGYDTAVVTSTIASILEKQAADGSWDSIDLTAAAIQALLLYPDADGVSTAIEHATQYIHSSQRVNGSFGGNVDSTSWAIGAINALMPQSTNHVDWLRGQNRSPLDYLANVQAADGGMNDPSLPANSRLWSTSYALVASYERTWASLIGATPQFHTEDEGINDLSENTGGTSNTAGHQADLSTESVTPTTTLSEVSTPTSTLDHTTTTTEPTEDTPQSGSSDMSADYVAPEHRFDLVGVPISFGDGKLIYTEDNAPPSLQIAGASYTSEPPTDESLTIETSDDVPVEETPKEEPEVTIYEEASTASDVDETLSDDNSSTRAKRLFRLSGVAAAISALYLFWRMKQQA